MTVVSSRDGKNVGWLLWNGIRVGQTEEMQQERYFGRSSSDV